MYKNTPLCERENSLLTFLSSYIGDKLRSKISVTFTGMKASVAIQLFSLCDELKSDIVAELKEVMLEEWVWRPSLLIPNYKYKFYSDLSFDLEEDYDRAEYVNLLPIYKTYFTDDEMEVLLNEEEAV